MTVLSRCRFLAVRAGLSSPSSVTNTYHAEIAISVCHHGPSLNSRTREERLCLLPCLLSVFQHPKPLIGSLRDELLWALILYFLALASMDLLLPTATSSARSSLPSRCHAAASWRLCAASTRHTRPLSTVLCPSSLLAELTGWWVPSFGKAACPTPLVLRLHAACRWYVCTRTYRLEKCHAWKLGGQGSTGWWQTAKTEVRETCSCLTTPLAPAVDVHAAVAGTSRSLCSLASGSHLCGVWWDRGPFSPFHQQPCCICCCLLAPQLAPPSRDCLIQLLVEQGLQF